MCNTLNNNDYIFKVKTDYMAQIIPIWQDYYVEFNTNDSPISYGIYEVGDFGTTEHNDVTYQNTENLIFSGKAWAAPSYDQNTFKTNINKICEDYLSNDFNSFAAVGTNGKNVEHTDAMKTFVIKNEDNGAEIDRVTFIYDWSFDSTVTYAEGQSTEMSHPINGKGVSGMYYFRTVFNGTYVRTLASRTPLSGYTETTECNAGKWALYYLNRYGGWDSYLIDGYVSRKNNFVRKNVVKSFNNNTLEFGNKPYMTQITPNYEIHTGWMNDRESEVLAANVFQSTRVYLHNLETEEVIPIVITDADVLHKNHKNSGRRLLNYTINAVSAQTEHNKN